MLLDGPGLPGAYNKNDNFIVGVVNAQIPNFKTDEPNRVFVKYLSFRHSIRIAQKFVIAQK